MKFDPFISRHIDTSSKIKRAMKYCQRFTFCHIDLIQHGKSTILRCTADRTRSENYLLILKGIHTDQRCRVHIDMERDIPAGTPKRSGKIFRENIFSGRFMSHQQDIFPAKKRRHCFFPDIRSIINIVRNRYSGLKLLLHRILFPERENRLF